MRVGSPVIEFDGVTKTFPGVLALDAVSLDILPGEVHALMGENGAGKSTLMKILAGVYAADSGTIRVNGQVVTLSDPYAAQHLGIRMIYQELTVLPNLDIGRNLMLGREVQRRGVIDWNATYAQAQQVLAELGITLDVRMLLEHLPLGQQQMVEIARALVDTPQVIVMDEPTSSLSAGEDEALFSLILRLKARGVSIVYISHRMDEVFRLADRITVLRDGTWVGTWQTRELTEAQLIISMGGRPLISREPNVRTSGSAVLSVSHLASLPQVRDVTFELHQGEILGFGGLVGAGRTETALTLFGAKTLTSGDVRLFDKAVRLRSPEDAIRAGLAYVPEDRKSLGLILSHSVRANIALPLLKHFSSLIGLRSAPINALVASSVQRLRIRTPNANQEVGLLSGGNQQKVVLAKWLATNPSILILDEPTRGIDVSAKAEVYSLMRELAGAGMAIILISSETTELLREADRILVFREGSIAGELTGADATEEQLLTLAFGRGNHAFGTAGQLRA